MTSEDPRDGSFEWRRRGTALSGLFPHTLPGSGRARFGRLFVEALLVAALAIGISRLADASAASVISVFLISAGLLPRFEQLLDENRAAVMSGHAKGVNLRTAVSLFALFLGVFLLYATAVRFLAPEARVEESMAGFGGAGDLEGETILTRHFGSFSGIFLHNASVLAAFCLLSLIYRSFGALLSLTWNAGVWALTLGVLIRRAAVVSGVSKGAFLVLAWSAVLPHLLLEAAAYTTTSVASIFLSRALLLYSTDDPRLRGAVGAAFRLMLAGTALLAAAALAEAVLPKHVLSWLGHEIQPAAH